MARAGRGGRMTLGRWEGARRGEPRNGDAVSAGWDEGPGEDDDNVEILKSNTRKDGGKSEIVVAKALRYECG